MTAAVTFVALTEEHRPMLLRWLSTPHAQQWWGEPQEELRLIYAIEDGEHEPFIACINDEPMAYIQAWWPTQHPDFPWQHGMTSTTRGIDITIGEETNLGKGLGTLIVKHFAAKLFAEGATRLIIDPDKTNNRAIAAYMKAGFTPYDEYESDLLMELLPEDFDYGAGYAQD
jgi:aminoglycoside 6'-N-acetyltransferase